MYRRFKKLERSNVISVCPCHADWMFVHSGSTERTSLVGPLSLPCVVTGLTQIVLLPCAWNVAATETVKCLVLVLFCHIYLLLNAFNLQTQCSLLPVNLVVLVFLEYIEIQIGLCLLPICTVYRLSAVFLVLNFHTPPMVSDVVVLLYGALEGAICRSQCTDKCVAVGSTG